MFGAKQIINKVIDNYILRETAGVNDEMLAVAEIMCENIIEKYAFDLYWDYCSEEAGNDGYEDESVWNNIDITDDVEYNGKTYQYNLFYDDSSSRVQRGRTDGDTVEVNYYLIKQVLDDIYENGDVDEEKYHDYTVSRLRYKLFPVIEHELTHTLDKSGQDTQGTWLSSFPNDSTVESDVRECLYLFSDNEMNARIGSIGSIMTTAIRELLDFGSTDEISEILHSGEKFGDVVKELIFEDEDVMEELKLDAMKRYLGEISHYDNFQYKTRKDYLKYSHGRPSSFAYYLFKNDSRLSKNRNIKHLFETNFDGGEKAVYNFYSKLYKEYLGRIYRACYGVMRNYLEKKNLSLNNNINK